MFTSTPFDNHCPARASFLHQSYFLPPSTEVYVLNCGNVINAVTDGAKSGVFDGLRLGTPLYWWPGNSTMEIVMGTRLFLAVDKDSGPRPYTLPFSNIFFRFPWFTFFLMSAPWLEISQVLLYQTTIYQCPHHHQSINYLRPFLNLTFFSFPHHLLEHSI